MVHASKYGRHANGIFFRRHLGDLRPVIRRSKDLFSSRAEYAIQQKCWRFSNGAELIFRHLDSIDDAELYKGESFTRIYGEELADWPSHEPWFRVRGALRSPHGVPTKTIGTGNPGGPGQHWVKECYIDPSPLGYALIDAPFRDISGWQRLFIPARLTDNVILSRADPEYVRALRSVGSEALVRAWLEGDWNAVEGAFFSDFNLSKHVVPASVRPAEDWLKFRALDWGSEAPFCVLWCAISDGYARSEQLRRDFPRESILIYNEWYERGARLSAEQFAKGILERTDRYQAYTEADPSIFRQDGGPSIAERMAVEGCIVVPADNTRIAGWDQVRARLKGVDGRPMLYISERCPNLIRELQTAQHDRKHIEDVATDGDDHACFAAGTIVDGRGYIEDVGVLTRCATVVLRISFDTGEQVVCTPDHLFLGGDGEWYQARDLYGRLLCSAQNVKSSLELSIICAALIFLGRAVDCIAWFLSGTMGQFQKISMFTMSMVMFITTKLRIWRSSQSANMRLCTENLGHGGTSLLLAERPQPPGIVAKKGALGIGNTGRHLSGQCLHRLLLRLARCAGLLLRRSISIKQSTATKIVKPKLCVGVEPMKERRSVYCLTTPEGWFTVNGVVVTNCDTLRYACMSRPWVPKPVPEKPKGGLTFDEVMRRQSDRKVINV